MAPGAISQVVGKLVEFILSYAVTLAAISALAMALIELFKALLSWRDQFHKRRLAGWIQSVGMPRDMLQIIRAQYPSDEIDIPNSDNQFHHSVYAQLLRLTTGETADRRSMERDIDWTPWVISRGDALFALPLEKMMGQIQDAADHTMTSPDLNPHLYVFLTAGARIGDITNWYTWAKEPPARSPENASQAKQQADTFTRLRQFIRRRLDAFQVSTSYRWETGNQVASVVLGAALLFGSLLYLATPEDRQSPVAWLALAFASIIGGIMAPVAKDLVAALKKVRSGG